MLLVFFFNDPATTMIYTYGHTLSLHDALPIDVGKVQRHDVQEGSIGARQIDLHGGVIERGDPFQFLGVAGRGGVEALDGAEEAGAGALGRSEEHTSELQSLMRISYAVFCLKKKTNIIYKQQYQKSQDKQ